MYTPFPCDDVARMIRDGRLRRPLAVLLALLAFVAVPSARADEAASLAARVEAARQLVERVRGVRFRAPVASSLLPEKELEAVLGRKLVEDLPVPFETYAASLAAIGLIDPSPDLFSRLTRLYTRQVVGFYDPAEGKFYVVPERTGGGEGEAGDLMEQLLLSHELTHALQDQRLDLDRRMRGLRDSTDALLALHAFLEGEATVLMTEVLLESVPADAREALGSDPLEQILDSLADPSAVEGAEGVPEFLVKQLVFPYAAGTAWVRQKCAKGGWAAVDAVYDRLPSTTREILRPGVALSPRKRLSAADRPIARRVPAGMAAAYSDSLGEWVLGALLERAGAGEDASPAAAAWQDDRVVFFAPKGAPAGDGVGFLWRIRASSPAAATRIAGLLEPLYEGRSASERPSVTTRGAVVEVSRGAARRPAS
jgi:hypothetical protein